MIALLLLGCIAGGEVSLEAGGAAGPEPQECRCLFVEVAP